MNGLSNSTIICTLSGALPNNLMVLSSLNRSLAPVRGARAIFWDYLFIIMVAIFMLPGGALGQAISAKYYTLTANMNLREEWSTDSAVIQLLRKGEAFQILDHYKPDDSTCWFRIKTTSGLTGWFRGIYRGNARFVEKEAAKQGISDYDVVKKLGATKQRANIPEEEPENKEIEIENLKSDHDIEKERGAIKERANKDERYNSIREHVRRGAESGWLPESLKYAFVFNSLVAALVLGPVLGGIGTLVVTKRLAFFSQAIGNAALTGVAIGIVLGEPYTSPYVSLFSFCIIFGMAMVFTKNRTKMTTDTLIGVFLCVSLAIGACILLYVTAKVNVHVLDNVLFGSILTINELDLKVLFVISIICILSGLPLYNRMILSSFNPNLARVRGLKVTLLEYVFIIMVTIITVASVKIIGAVLVEALLVIPAASARNLSRSMRSFFLYSAIFSTLSCLIGIMAPMELEIPVPSGGAIILVAAFFFVTTTAIKTVKAAERKRPEA
jgi:zinc transport system permease protein